MSTRPATANDQLAWPASPRTGAMTKGRQADSARRRQRVIAALNKAASDGTESACRASPAPPVSAYRSTCIAGYGWTCR